MTVKATKTPSEDEDLKTRSRFLRGDIAADLTDEVTGAVSTGSGKLLKFHGIYQQDDRELRNERQQQKLEPLYSFLLRLRLPGGVCTPEQWLALDDLARRYAYPSLRITTRQTFQYHGVYKRNLKALVAGLADAGLDSIAACGDVNRNVVSHNNPYLSPLHAELHDWSRRLSERFLPKTRAYQEIWLDEKPTVDAQPEQEPLYGETYLPRKFKIGLALPPHNDIDVYAQDLGFIAIVKRGKITGFNVSVGGGMGMTHSDAATYPRTADVIGYCHPEQVLNVAEQVLSIQRDFGDRGNRKHARFKYTLDDRGTDWFLRELNSRLGFQLEPAQAFRFEHNGDPLGWVQDKQGLWHLTLGILSGRIKDTPETAWLSGLREIARIHQGDFRLTTNQNLTIAGIGADNKPRIEALLAEHRIPLPDDWSGIRRHAISCVSLPTCGLAMAESERWLPDLLNVLEPVLQRNGLSSEAITLRVTGCPNGCGRPFLGEIGLVGKSLGRYNLYLGAGFAGERLNKLYRENLTEDEIATVLTPLIEQYGKQRQKGEHFGDFLIRKKHIAAVSAGRDFHTGDNK